MASSSSEEFILKVVALRASEQEQGEKEEGITGRSKNGANSRDEEDWKEKEAAKSSSRLRAATALGGNSEVDVDALIKQRAVAATRGANGHKTCRFLRKRETPRDKPESPRQPPSSAINNSAQRDEASTIKEFEAMKEQKLAQDFDYDVLQVVHQRAKLLEPDNEGDGEEGINNMRRGRTQQGEDDMPQTDPQAAAHQPPQLRRGEPMRDESQPGAWLEAPGEGMHQTDRLRYSLVGVQAIDYDSSEFMSLEGDDDEKTHQTMTGSSTFFSSSLALEDSTRPGNGGDTDMVEARPITEEEEEDLEEAEPVDLEAQKTEEELRNRMDRKYLIIGLLIVLIGVIVVAVVAVVYVGKTGDGNDKLETAEGVYPNLQPVSPTNNPTTPAPSSTTSPAKDLMLSHLPEYTKKSLKDPNSPQSLAFHWVTTHYDVFELEEWRRNQLLALASFYYAFDGPTWPWGLDKDWLDPLKSECEWFSNLYGRFPEFGVYVETFVPGFSEGPCNENGEYRAMVCLDSPGDIVFNTTAIPPEMALLTSLEKVMMRMHTNFANTTLFGVIPSELMQLTKLETLSFASNELIGTVPSYLGLSPSLKILNITGNLLTGTIPSQLGVASSLVRLDLSNNSLTGTVPGELAALVISGNLTHLNLEGNARLHGTIPEELCGLEKDSCQSSSQLQPGEESSCALVFDCSPQLCGCNCACS